ncbi:acetyltransferase (GNAT) family protein [Melghirimyces profundicolus]|uniref:Acetyltransferase (GNAT) family protein n=1 Tax=Melghirimyces profundicolus TaxID=1242148 RepID=A0A2T6BCG3_9BACL|nr:GNAT family N-acetyltransferase [Melghirimyces profundicolus]PTX53706.1 acetyltransferase (GNAT) family protein [Melghirimyces profundicolus]
MQTHAENVQIRKMTYGDIDQVVTLALEGFGEEVAFKPEHYESQIRLFPEGQICAELNGKIIGSSSSLIINFDDYNRQHTLSEISDQGYIRNHDPNGHHLYGIEVVVHSRYRQMKVGQRLYDARRQLCKKLNLKSILIGGRIPYYHKYADRYTAWEYARQVVQGKLYDPVLTFQSKNGFQLIDVLENYLPGDKESLKYATFMEWENVDYRLQKTTSPHASTTK